MAETRQVLRKALALILSVTLASSIAFPSTAFADELNTTNGAVTDATEGGSSQGEVPATDEGGSESPGTEALPTAEQGSVPQGDQDPAAEPAPQAIEAGDVAVVGDEGYPTLAEAIAAAQDGDTVVLQQDVDVAEIIEVAHSITLNLNGHAISNLVQEERLFSVTASAFTVDGTTAGSAMAIPESNAGSYGFIKVAATSTVTLNGGTYSGNTDNGAFVKVFHNDTLDASGSTVVYNNVTMTSNNRFFSTDTLTTDAETPTLQVSGGAFTTDGQAFGMDVRYHSPVTFIDATVTAGAGPCIEVCGPAATFTNCTFTVTRENGNGFGATAVATSWSGTAEINGGTYSAPHGYGVYVYNSGGKITIKDGAVSGGDAAVRADANIQSSSPQQSTVIVEGGSTDGAWQTSDAENAPLVVLGGTHTANVSDYLAEGCSLTKSEGVYIVQQDQVAQVGERYYGTLERALANAGAGETVTLLKDVTIDATITLAEDDDVTLDLAGHTIGTVQESDGDHLYVIDNYGRLTIKDSVGDGAIEARGLDNYGTLTLESGTIKAIDDNGGAAVWNEGAFFMTGGRLSAVTAPEGNTAAPALNNRESATACITGGALDSVTWAISNVGILTIENAAITSNHPTGLSSTWNCVKTFAGSTATFTNVTINANGNGGIEAAGGEVTLNDCAITQEGVANPQGWNAMCVAANSGSGKVTINGGTYVSEDTCVYIFNSGATIDINGGTFTAPTALQADATDSSQSYINVAGGSFEGAVSTGGTAANCHYAISGGTFSQAFDESYLAEGFQLIGDDENGYGVYGEDALVAIDGNGTGYVDFLTAFTTATGELTLLQDVSISEDNLGGSYRVTLPAGHELALNLNGHRVSVTDSKGFTINGSLTVRDGSAEQTGAISGDGCATYFVQVTEGGRLSLESGTIEDVTETGSTTSRYVVRVTGSNASFDMTGGTIASTARTLFVISGASATITGGNVTPSAPTNRAIYMSSSSSKLTVGTEGNFDSPIINGIVYMVSNAPDINLVGGTIANIQGSYSASTIASHFMNDVSSILPSGMQCVQEGDYWVVKELTSEDEAGAKIVTADNETKLYDSAKSAAGDLQVGDTLTLLEDVVRDGTSTILEVNVPGVTIDLNGHSVSGDSAQYGIYIKVNSANSYDSLIDLPVVVTSTQPGAQVSGSRAAVLITSNLSNYPAFLDYQGGNIELESETTPIALNFGSVKYSEEIASLISDGGFRVTVDGTDYVYGGLMSALRASDTTIATLMNDYSTTAIGITSIENGVLDLDGHTITASSDTAIALNASNIGMTIKNGTIVSAPDDDTEAPVGIGVIPGSSNPYDNVSLTLDGVTLKMTVDGGMGMYSNGTNSNTIFTLINSSIEAPAGTMGIYFPPTGGSSLTLTGSSITAGTGIGMKGGTLTVSGDSVVNATGAKVDPQPTPAGGGTTNTGDAIFVDAGYTNSRDVIVNIEDGTFASENGYALQLANTIEDAPYTATVEVSGGTYDDESAQPYLAYGYELGENGQGGYAVSEMPDVAQVGGEGYPYLSDAIAAAQPGETVTLLDDVTVDAKIILAEGDDVTLDLAGHNVALGSNAYFFVNGGTFNVTGEGKIYETDPYWAAIMVEGSTTDVADYSVVNVGENVTLEGWSGVFIDNNGSATAYGVKVDMNGHINSITDRSGANGHGIYINGSITPTEGNVPEITVGANATIDSLGNGIYAAGYAKWDIAGTVKGVTGMEIRAGELTVRDSAHFIGGDGDFEYDANGNGSTSNNAALVVSQHTTKLPVIVDVLGGTFEATEAFAQINPEDNDQASIDQVDVEITGGVFKGAVYSENFSSEAGNGFISGGTFDNESAASFLAHGYELVDAGSGSFGVAALTAAKVGETVYPYL